MSVGAPRIVTGPFALLWAGTFVFCFSFYLLLPALPLYARTLGIPDSQIGLIIGFFAVSSMASKPLAGWIADRYGRRPLLVAGSVLFVCASALYGVSRSAEALLAVRIVHGAGMGLYPTGASAMVADLSPPARRGEAMGLYGAAANVALALGPLGAVGLSSALGYHGLFALATAVALVALALTAVQPETLAARSRERFRIGAVMSTAVAYPCAIVFCLMTTYGLQVAFLPLYTQARGTNPGIFFLVLALAVALVRGYAGQCSDRIGRAPVAAAGMVLTATSLGALAISAGPLAMALAGALYGVGFGTAQPALMAWAVDLVAPADRGKALGTYYAALELGIGAGAVGFGLLLTRTSFPIAFGAAVALALAGAALALSRFSR